jgi:ABC-type sugar transport system ATPase subunit
MIVNATAPTLSCTETWVKINDDALRKELDKLLEKIGPGEISFGHNPVRDVSFASRQVLEVLYLR